MEIVRPTVVIGGQPPGKVLDVIMLPVPFSHTMEELQDRIIVGHMGRLDIGADVVHPTLSALLHLFHHDGTQLAVVERLPFTETQVVVSEFHHLFHHVIAQLIAPLKKVFYRAHDAFLLVHLRERTPFAGLLIGRTEGLADEVVALLTEPRHPADSAHTPLFGQLCRSTIVGQQLQAMVHIVVVYRKGFLQTGLQFHFHTSLLFGLSRIVHHSVIIGHGSGILVCSFVFAKNHRQRLGCGVVIKAGIIAQPATSLQRWLFGNDTATRKRFVDVGGVALCLCEHFLPEIVGQSDHHF